ncbi:hypothetical protein [Saccharopolyspora soli]|nr:hypothetical protein [Saccharopolyspora soli]
MAESHSAGGAAALLVIVTTLEIRLIRHGLGARLIPFPPQDKIE